MKVKKNASLVLGLSLVLSVILTSGCINLKNKLGELTNLADKYGSDKGSYAFGNHKSWKIDKMRRGHCYTKIYEYFFYPIKYEARKICEIGIGAGASLKMFRDYFPKAVIYGIDINDASSLNSNTIKTFVADQANREQLKNFIDTYGYNFDIILDDGGHTIEQQLVSFGYLFKYLKPGGYYIIEDMYTSLPGFHSRYGGEENEENTTLAMIYDFIKSGKIKSTYMTTEEQNYLTANIEYCNLLTVKDRDAIACIFKKR